MQLKPLVQSIKCAASPVHMPSLVCPLYHGLSADTVIKKQGQKLVRENVKRDIILS